MSYDRKNYNNTLRTDLLKKLKILAVENDCRVNDLLEEAIEDILKKYHEAATQKEKASTKEPEYTSEGRVKRKINI